MLGYTGTPTSCLQVAITQHLSILAQPTLAKAPVLGPCLSGQKWTPKAWIFAVSPSPMESGFVKIWCKGS